MKFLILHSTDPYLNLAIEEHLFRTEREDVFMLWQNEPTVVIGKNQNAYAEVELAYLKEQGIHLARRITGGGAVYHDLGNVNYTFISNSGQTGIDFAGFTAPVLEALASLGIHAELSGRNDLLVDGKKFSGNAQHSANGRTLHHGTLLFDSDLTVLSAALRPDEEKLKSKAVKSTRSRVTNLAPLLQKSATTGEFIALIADFVRQKYRPVEISAPMGEEVEQLRARNASHEWLYPERELLAGYTLAKKKRYPFGSVELLLEMHNDRIKTLTVCGDFFGNRPVEALAASLCGARLCEVSARLADMDVGEYIYGMSAEALTALIAED